MPHRKAKCFFISMPDFEKLPVSHEKWQQISVNIEAMLTRELGEPIGVCMWNTDIKFLTVQDVSKLIHDLKLLKKKVSDE